MLKRHGRYKVNIYSDGSIKVKQGDCLSEYSVALHGDPWQLNQFARLDGSDNLEYIRNVNLIYTGERIYHIETYNRWLRMNKIMLSEALSYKHKARGKPANFVRKSSAIKLITKVYDLKGTDIRLLEKSWDVLGKMKDAFDLLDEFASLTSKLSGPALGAIAFAGIIMTAIDMYLAINYAFSTNERLYKLLASTYTFIAWVFSDNEPFESKRYLDNQVKKWEIYSLRLAWNKEKRNTEKNIYDFLRAENVSQKVAKEYFKLRFENSRKKLFQSLMRHVYELKKDEWVTERDAIRSYIRHWEYPD